MVHQYQLNGYNIVLDSCSGSVHVVDDVAYDVIAMYKEHSADEIVAAMLAKYADRPDVTEADLRQCLEDVASLEAAGKLWAPDVYKDMAFDFKNRQTVVKALCLHVAHTCNLNCRLSGRQFSFDILFANYRQKRSCSCRSFLRKNPPLGAVLCYTIR